MSRLVLGIDVGTTSVKVVLVQPDGQTILANQSKDTQANVPSDLGVEGNKQDVPKILSAIHSCVSRLPKDLLKQVESIGICGQMHGVTLWKSDAVAATTSSGGGGATNNGHQNQFKLDIDKDGVSHLYTWQDGRCDIGFLDSLPRSSSHLALHTGYGCATLFWFAKNKPEKLKKYDRCGTVQDLVVSLLCGSAEGPVRMSNQNAASWGYFCTEACDWDREALARGDFPERLLPQEVLGPGESAGRLCRSWFGIPKGVNIGVALGDLQCSVYALLKQPSDAVLNISTSAQLAYVHPTLKPDAINESKKIEYFPYFDDKYLAVAASLNGGNTLATFVKSLQQWILDLGFSVPQSKVWEKLIKLAADEATSRSDMQIVPTLLGERYAPQQTASVSGISLDTLDLGSIFRALCSGIIKNLHDMMPRDELAAFGIERIVGNGSGLVRNPVLQQEVSHWYRLPLELGHSGDAALGAALALLQTNG
ncbi:sedoheptulokinase-like [Trichogramma pretiosum]|uniref:sedoheptulokinase-like n=1 Tax=Trichogramma pretiosum TaxID=7493 RepID=UPI0006C972C0|nr:sedoheptulokinase-like [Trichogramma pretiosum]XP_023315814.1 sedoheptulokinase-like [Trichogramma pretiosum]XP_023315815.1 sedoheptulokinase-like [Trichogramma pretiosum]XP_023315816.1 sedoheptulokinase-like [Trichogramma pretiosum]XP_023315817.1 sedoheptulokinase-like [Trichogramma pretiosum]